MARQKKKKKAKLPAVVVAVIALAALAGGNEKTASVSETSVPEVLATAAIEIKTDVPITAAPTVRVTTQPTKQAAVSATATPKPQMVWVTSGGSKYHSKSTCSNMKSPRQITKTDAVQQGYSPCKKCY